MFVCPVGWGVLLCQVHKQCQCICPIHICYFPLKSHSFWWQGWRPLTAAPFMFTVSSEHCLSVAVCWDVLHQPYLSPIFTKWEIQGNGAPNFSTTLHQARGCPAQERRKFLQNSEKSQVFFFFFISLSKCYFLPSPLPSLFYWSMFPQLGFPYKQNAFL